MKSILKMGKKGVFGMDSAKAFIIAIMTLAIIAFAVLIALSELNNSSASTADTSQIFGNVSAGLVTLFTNAGTWFSLLAVVIIILIVAVVVIAVNRFGTTAGGL